MGLKKFNAKKEIKKLKRRSSKLKKVGVIGAIIGTIFIVSSYSLYSYTKSSVAFNSTISKKIQVTINVENGKIENSTSKIVETDYNQTITETVTPNEEYEYDATTCTDNNIKTTYTGNKLTISNAKQDTTCIVKFKCKLKTGEKKTIFGKSYDVLASCNQDFTKGFPNSETSSTDSNNKSGLYKAEDDQGASYYFRGDKSLLNNNVEFGGKKWKIVRINGDGTIRLILVDNFTDSSHPLSIESYKFNNYTNDGGAQHNMVGFTYENKTHKCTKANPCEVIYSNGTFNNSNFGGKNSDIKTELETWYKNNLTTADSKIAFGYFCNDTSSPRYTYDASNTSQVEYGAHDRIHKQYQPSLECPDPKDNKGTIRPYGGIYKTKIGLLTADEINMAGLSWYEPCALINNYLYYINSEWWSLSPRFSNNSALMFVGNNGYLYNHTTYYNYAVVPVINLNANVTATGDGSATIPFVIK